MPNRYLRASYVESERINSVSMQAEVVWTHLLVTVDDFGRCEANPKILRPKLFPLRLDQIREADLQRLIAECEKAGLVRLYEVEGKRYLQMEKWEQGRAAVSKFPPPPTDANKCFQPQTDASGCKQMSTAAPDSDSDSDPDTDTDNDSDPEGKGARASGRTVPPTDEELRLAVEMAGLPPAEGVKFRNYYESNGWRVGRNPMRSWRHALGTWKARYEETRHDRAAGPHHRRATAPNDHVVAGRAELAARLGAQNDAAMDGPVPV